MQYQQSPLGGAYLSQVSITQSDTGIAAMTRYTVIADNTIGSTDDFGFGARIAMAPTRATSPELVSYGVAEGNVFLEPAAVSLATDDGWLSGYNLACRGNTQATPGVRRGCVDVGRNAVPAQKVCSRNCSYFR